MTGVIIRPPVFNQRAPAPPAMPVRRPRRVVDGRLVALLAMAIGLALLLAIAGTSFTIRVTILIIMTLVAGRTPSTPRTRPA
jgi:hypothetical protein